MTEIMVEGAQSRNTRRMLLVESYLAPSPVHGIGLFAKAFIPRGTPMWTLMPKFDLLLSEEDLASLPPTTLAQIDHYIYLDKTLNVHVLCGDDARFYNHSDDPNTGGIATGDPATDYALRDIKPGEEILCDYSSFTVHDGF